MTQVCKHIGLANGAKVDFKYSRLYPVTVNHEAQTAFSASVARQIVGDIRVDDNTPPVMGGEDFSFMLEARPAPSFSLVRAIRQECITLSMTSTTISFLSDVLIGSSWSRPQCLQMADCSDNAPGRVANVVDHHLLDRHDLRVCGFGTARQAEILTSGRLP